MKCCSLNLFGAVLLALFVAVGTADAQLTLVPNGNFSTAAGANWVSASVGAVASYPAAGGNTGGYGLLDQTAAGWGGVLVSEDSATVGRSLTSLGVTAGTTRTFSIDLRSFGAGTPLAGMKMESWNGGVIGTNSGDVVFATSSNWTTRTFTYAIDANATSLKFVPLMVGQAIGSQVGFDNIGVVNAIPEPASLGLVGLGLVGLVARRRRK